jgi:uncharacterized phage protein gp47/JayE
VATLTVRIKDRLDAELREVAVRPGTDKERVRALLSRFAMRVRRLPAPNPSVET